MKKILVELMNQLLHFKTIHQLVRWTDNGLTHGLTNGLTILLGPVD